MVKLLPDNTMRKKCRHCQEGYIRTNGVYLPCRECITPQRFEKTLATAINNCENDTLKRKALIRIKENLPEYPVMALLEAEAYEKFSKEFVDMLKAAYDIKAFMDVMYKKIK